MFAPLRSILSPLSSVCRLSFSFFVLLLPLLNGFTQLLAQEINSWQTTPLSAPEWSGTKDKFLLQTDELHLSDSSPLTRGNEAWLFYPQILGTETNLRGEVTFDFTPTNQNYFCLFLYPCSIQEDTDQGKQQRFVALWVGEYKVVQLVSVLLTWRHDGTPILSEKELLIADLPLYAFDSPPHRLSWQLSWTQQEGCTLWLNTHNSLRKEMRKAGSMGEESMPAPISGPSKWGMYCRYTKNKAKGWRLIRWEKANTTVPIGDSEPEPQESLFHDISYSPERLTLHCKTAIDTHKLSVRLDPPRGSIQPVLEKQLLHLYFEQPLSEGRYRLTLENLYTEKGIPCPDEEFIFSLEKEMPVVDSLKKDDCEGNVQLSEVMYHPIWGGSEYVELFNPTTTSIDLQHYGLALRTEGRLGKIYPIRGRNTLIAPGQYKAVTPWSKSLVEQFQTPIDSLVEMEHFPNLPNMRGQIALIRLKDTLSVEEVLYHLEGRESKEAVQGMAWARRSFEQSASDPDNWRRVRGDEFFGSPGRDNNHAQKSEHREGKEMEAFKTPKDVALFILHNEREKGFGVQAHWYSVSGKKIAHYNHEQMLLWSRNIIQNKEPLLPMQQQPKNWIIAAIEMKKSDWKRPQKVQFFFR